MWRILREESSFTGSASCGFDAFLNKMCARNRRAFSSPFLLRARLGVARANRASERNAEVWHG
jgi:hypothetical protein